MDLWNQVYQDFGKFNSLRNALSLTKSSVKYETFFVLAFYVDKATHIYTYKVEIQQRKKTMTTARKIADIYGVIFSCGSYISSLNLFLFWYYHCLTEITNQLS